MLFRSDEKGRPTRKALSLRKWNCEEQRGDRPAAYSDAAERGIYEVSPQTLGSYIKKASASRKKSLEGPKADIKTWGKRQKGITTATSKLVGTAKVPAGHENEPPFDNSKKRSHEKMSVKVKKLANKGMQGVKEAQQDKDWPDYNVPFGERTNRMDNKDKIQEAIGKIGRAHV